MAQYMDLGMVAALAYGKAKARASEGWARDLEKVWDRSTGVLLKQKGFLGLRCLWCSDDSGEVIILGMWDTMAHRLAYEASVSKGVRGAFEETMQGPARRLKYIVVKKTAS